LLGKALTKYNFFKQADMKRIFLIPVMAAALLAGNAPVAMAKGEKTVMVGGAAMYPSKNIVENAVNSKDHTTLVAAVKAAGLVETLQGDGPFTVFAPTNKAFDRLPAGTVDKLVQPEMKDQLTGILTYHVVSGKVDSKELMRMIKAGSGKAKLTTVQGEELTAKMKGAGIVLMDAKGGTSMVTIKDVYQKNGVIHVVDHVLMP
jgi:uncharacterized surface protein with fasciclin (FAS1) repeats